MAIGNAIQKGAWVYIYDDNGRQKAAIAAGSLPGDGLKGHDSETVNVRRGSLIYSFNEEGGLESTSPAE